MKKTSILFLLFLSVSWIQAKVYYVSSTGSGTDGLTWATAFTSPAAAIASTTPVAGDEFWVKQGTYISSTTLSWETGQHFYGGFTGTETLRSQRSTDASLTILEGTNTNRVLNAPSMASPTTWDGFTIQKGLTTGGGAGAFLQKNAILQNCIIQNNKTTDFGGGGIFIQGLIADTDSIKVLNCIVKNNINTKSGAAKRGGGGIYVKAGSLKAVIRGCTIEGNIADGLANSGSDIGGGGVYICDGILENSVIKNNIVTNKNATTSALEYASKCQGGGVFIMPQTTTNPIIVRNCTITGNMANTFAGGGISIDPLLGTTYLIAAPVNILNSKITNNTAYKNGGGIMTDGKEPTSTSNYLFTNCIIANNESSTVAAGGGGVFVNNVTNYAGTVAFRNCHVVNNKMLTTDNGGAGIYYNNIKADITNCAFWGNGSTGTLSPFHVRVKTTLTTNKLVNCVFDNQFVESEVSPIGTPADLSNKLIVDLSNTGSAPGTLYANFVSPTNFIGKVVTQSDQTSLDAADWSLAYNSAAVNAGTTIAEITKDITGLQRPQGSAYDIGAYELRAYNITASSSDENKGSITGSGTKLSGSAVTLEATANTDYHFVNWTSGGNIVSTNSSYSFTASEDKTIVANFEADSHIINSGSINASDIPCTTCDVVVSTGAELNINEPKTLKSISLSPGAKLTINANKSLNTTNGIVLQSDENGTATIVDLTTSNPQSITATVKQYLTAGRNWYLSIPFANASSSFFNKGTSVVCFDEPTGEWISPAGGILNKMQGYIQVAKSTPEVTGTTGTIELNGELNTGEQSINLTRTEGKTGFNLVGNPFPSYLDWNLVTKNNVSNTMWLRTKEASVYKFYTYVANNGSGIGSPATVTNLIPPMQAFWVRVNTVAGGSIAVDNQMRAHKDVTGNILKAPKTDNQKILRMQVSNGTNTDESVIYFNADASADLDNFDAVKRTNNNPAIPEIYTEAGGETLVINGMNDIPFNSEIPLGFKTDQYNQFTLSVNEFSNFEEGTKIILKDKYATSEIEIDANTPYHFSSDITVNPMDRFSLTFKAPDLTTDFKNTSENMSTRIFLNTENQITIFSKNIFNYMIFNSVGQQIHNGRCNNNEITFKSLNEKGIYIIKVTDEPGFEFSSKLIIK